MGAPALILFLAFYLYPALQNLQFATRRWDGITEPENVGFRNFTNLLTNDDLFYKTLGNNLEFTFLVVIFQTALALIFAVFLVKNTKTNIALRTLYFFPTILSALDAYCWAGLVYPVAEKNLPLLTSISGKAPPSFCKSDRPTLALLSV